MRPLSELVTTRGMFERCAWEAVIRECDERDCAQYSPALFAAARSVTSDECRAVLEILGAITSMMMDPSGRFSPFSPVGRMGDLRTADVPDFTADQLDVLSEVVPSVQDAELRARIGDVLWVARRDHIAGRIASLAYSDVAIATADPDNWPPAVDRLVRALEISVVLGRKSDAYAKAIGAIETLLAQWHGSDTKFGTVRLMALLIGREEGDYGRYAHLATRAAEEKELAGNWDLAREYWTTVAGWFGLLDQPDAALSARLRACETYVAEAQRFVGDQPFYTMACDRLEKAIVCFRRVQGTKERVQELHKQLLEWQQLAVREMKPITVPVAPNIDDIVEAVRQLVKGKPLHEAILLLVQSGPSPKRSQLEAKVREALREFPMQSLFANTFLNAQGKTTAKTGSMFGAAEADVDAGIVKQMFHDARLHRGMMATSTIDPARVQIERDHGVQLRDVGKLVEESAFVPAGREALYALGLHAGFKGDYATATHILLPQLEHSLRLLVASKGLLVSGLNDEGIQEEYDLNRILCQQEFAGALEGILGEDIVFDLRGLLVERTGSNLRNRAVHGLMDAAEFQSAETCYLWWLALVLCVCVKHQTSDNEF